MASILNATTTAGVTVTGDNSGSLQLATNNGTTAVTIDTSQNVGIGTSSPAYRLDVKAATAVTRIQSTTGTNEAYLDLNNTGGDFYIGRDNSAGSAFTSSAYASVLYSAGAYPMVFFTNSTERMRIDSSGNLLVGTTSASTPSGVTSKVVSQGSFGAGAGAYGLSISSTTTGINQFYISFQTATTTERGYIWYNNGAGQVQLAATSDARLKENIVDAPSALPIIEQVKVRQYAWKDTGNTNIGFIAQELNNVIPKAVAIGEDNEDGSIKRTWGVDNATLVPYLVKAIQELKAELDATKAEVQALKGTL
jgi:hypothetical protein